VNGRLSELVARRELLRSRAQLERLEARAALQDLRAFHPLREVRSLFGRPKVRNRMIELLVIAVGSTRLQRTARWFARGVLLVRLIGLVYSLRRGAGAAARSGGPGATARPTP
jgi:hypothetical protein